MSISKYYDVLAAVADTYISLHLFDLEKGSYEAIKSSERIDSWAAGRTLFHEALRNVMEHVSVPEDLEYILEFTDLNSLAERLQGQKSVSAVFRGQAIGWCRARFIVVDRREDGSPCRILFAVENINEEKKREDRLKHMAQMDMLTGISNRGYGEFCVRQALEQEENGLFCLFDIDRFKQVNDFYGHDIGDQVLAAVGDAMKKVLRRGDIFFRLGGDEFAFYAVGADDPSKADRVISRLFEQLEKVHVAPMREHISVSLGAAFREEGSTFESLYKKADDGVYMSKRNKGKSTYFLEP